MFELKDLPSPETLTRFAALYGNRDVPGLHAWLVWAAATSEMLTAFEDHLARNGLSQTQFFVLLLLKRNPDGLSVGALASGVAITSQSMTRALGKMEAAGICSKQATPEDGRLWNVRLTPAGEAILAKVLPRHYAWVTHLMSHYSSTERDALVSLMLKVGPALATPPSRPSAD